MRLMTLAFAAALAAGAANAGNKADPVKFRFNAAVLASPDGAEALYRAMRAKAVSKCDLRGDRMRSAVDACADDLVTQWVDAVGDDRLTALHEASGDRARALGGRP